MNNLAKTTAVTGSIAAVLALVPAQYAICPAGLIVLCAILSAVLTPPADGSRWATAYRLVVLLGANVGWAANRISDAAQAKAEGHDGGLH